MERRPDPYDRRAYRLYLREQADKALDDIRAAGAAIHVTALQGISETEALVLASALRKMRANLSTR
ncbi:hypothetical protein D9M68_764460 [compost metagenome]